MSDTVEVPVPMRALPRDHHDRPIPWFVHIDDDGVPDFRVVRRAGIPDAYRFGWCWVCGQRRGRHAAFVIGPMCAVNHVSAEPPSHLDCALYSAQACPFLTRPAMRRRDSNLPEDRIDPAGDMIRRNPGVALVWSSKTWKPFPVPAEHGGGSLFDVGDATSVRWLTEGRPATRVEVLASIDSGMPLLREQAESDPRPDAALADLDRPREAARKLAPA
jgi:hypothetical protein